LSENEIYGEHVHNIYVYSKCSISIWVSILPLGNISTLLLPTLLPAPLTHPDTIQKGGMGYVILAAVLSGPVGRQKAIVLAAFLSNRNIFPGSTHTRVIGHQ
tara:strand:- start:342 stop:647 length:306 start_codon:yes stop_codon:yes gene_type:complete